MRVRGLSTFSRSRGSILGLVRVRTGIGRRSCRIRLCGGTGYGVVFGLGIFVRNCSRGIGSSWLYQYHSNLESSISYQ